MEKQILYVDDEEENLIGFKAVFRKSYSIHVALDTQEAMEILKKHEIKVLITDQRMANENGLDFLKRINPQFPNIICILLTAYSDMQIVIQAINQGGVFRYLLKPWDKAEMQMVIDSALETYDLRKQNELLIHELKLKNEALQKSEATFRNIFNTSVDSIVITDKKGKFLDINNMAIVKLGIPKEQLLQLSIFDLAEENIEQIRKFLDNPTLDSFYEVSTSYINPNTGQRIYLEARSTLINYENETAFLHIIRDITERLDMEKKLLKTVIETEEKERNRLARELHDGVSPVLAATRLYAQSFTSKKDKNLEPIILKRLEETIDEAIQGIQEISNNLSPHILQNFGLNSAINNYIEKLKDTQNINFRVNIEPGNRLPENIETNVYRILVELINNTIKYAQANEINIELTVPKNIELTYRDNGKGFDYNECLKQRKGMGFYNIQSRIKTLNGTLNIFSEIDQGIKVTILIPAP